MKQCARKLIRAVAFLAFCSSITQLPASAQGWSNGYAFRRTITIDHTKVSNTDQANFPFLFSGTLTDMATVANGGAVTNANGFDIILTSDANGSTLLPFEQEFYNSANGNFIYWVQIPTLSHTTDTVFYVFYGNSSITTDQSNKTGVWDSNFKGVWHLANGTTLSGADSTSNAYNLTNNNSTAATAGQIDGAASFNGTNNYLSNSQLSIAAGSSITISYWSYVASANVQNSSAFTIGASDNPNRIQANAPWSDNNLYWDYGNCCTGSAGGRVSTSYANYLNHWTYVVLEFNSSNSTHSIYFNGGLAASNVNSNSPQVAQTGIDVGAWPTGVYQHGIIDEFRVSTVARSADWIATEYTNQTSPASFVVIGSAASGPNALMISTVSPKLADYGDSVTIQGANFGANQGNSTVSFNGSPLVPQSWSNAAIGVSVPFGATSDSFSVTVNNVTVVSPLLSIRPLPSGWLDQDVGAVSTAGSASYSLESFAVSATGTGESGSADAIHFAYQPLSGDGTIVARLVTGVAPGVMIRETLNANATEVSLVWYNSNIYFNYRSSTGGGTTNPSSSVGSLPYWVKLVRSGNTFTGYIAPDGLNWTQITSSQTITMAQNVYVGLVASGSGSNGSTLNTATFDNVSISSTSSPGPVIASISPTTAAVGSQVVISGSNFGNSQNGSLVTLGTMPVTINNWSSTSITFTVPSGATSGPLVVSVAPSMNDSNAVPFYVHSVPGAWLDQDVGSVIAVGAAGYANGTFTLQGAGAGIGGNADGFHFAYQSLSGDGTIVTRIASIRGFNGSAGIMIRETLNASAANVYINFTLDNNWFIGDYRSTTGGSTSNNIFNPWIARPPYWVKLARVGSTFSPSLSSDGVNWTALGSVTINMAQNVYIGLAVSSERSTTITATFDNVSITSAAAPAPVISSISENTGFIGSRVVISGSNFGASQGSSLVTLNAAPMTVNAWSNTSITFTVSSGSSGPLVVSVAPNMNDSNPVYFTLIQQGQVQQVPTGWLDQDIWDGTTQGQSGSGTYDNGIFTVNGSGAYIWNTKDGFNFYYLPLSGDGTIIARLLGASGGSSNQSTGVMIREALLPWSTNVYTSLGGGNSDIYVTARTSTSGSTSSFGNTNPVTFPYWVKLVRSGNNFTGYSSPDGVTWTQVATTTISMAQNANVGLAVCSFNTGLTTTAMFDNISITPSPAQSTTAALVGTVSSASSGVAISGAQIQALQQGVVIATASSNGSGSYSMSNLPAGIYDVQFSASGFGTLVDSGFFVPVGVTTTLNANLSSPGTISGKVTQADGVTPISGAAVQALVGSASVSSATTDSNGNYSMTGLNEGSYNVQASASGYASANQSASVTANSTATANFSLSAQSAGAGRYVYDPLGRLVAVILQSGAAVVYNYDPVGNLLSISRPNSSQLSILGFAPARGPVGSTVTIYGTAFSTTPNQNTVKFNATTATVQSATSTQLVVTVPANSTTGTISVTVSGNTVTSSYSFTVGNP